MFSPCRASLPLLALLAACDREERDHRGSPLPQTGPTLAAIESGASDPRAGDYENNAYHVGQGMRTFVWMNCSGCHAHGGGGMGPPLTDEEWRYGGSMEAIAATIIEGRPNGMPSFEGKLTGHQVWQLAAFVRSLSAQNRQDALAGRADEISNREPPTLDERREQRRVTPMQDEGTVP
jgi:cytochrome c oxidase cbb3-type subunit III